MGRRIRRIAWIEPARFPYGYDDQHVFKGWVIPRAGPQMAGLLDSLGYDTVVYCGEGVPIDVQEIANNFDLACISVLSCTATHGLILGKQLSDLGMPVVAGGFHFAHALMTEETLAPTTEALDYVPYVVRGEGYKSLVELLEVFEGKRSPEGVLGLSYRFGDEKIHNPPQRLMTKEELNNLPLPKWEKVLGVRKGHVISIHGMYGCPRKCTWCAVWPRDGRGNRYIEPNKVVDAIEHALKVQGRDDGRITWIFFSADNFPAVRAWAEGVCEEIKRRKLPIKWTCQAEVAGAKRLQLVKLMKESGCEWWCIGFESISEESLKASEKAQSLKDMEEAIRILHAHGIKIHGMFICGLPGDSRESIMRTVDWAKRMGIETIQITCLVELPGSQDYETKRQWENAFRPFKPPYELLNWLFTNGHYARIATDKMSLYEVQRCAIEGMKRFYSIGHIVRSVLPNWNTLIYELRRGSGVLKSIKAACLDSIYTLALRARGFKLLRRWENSRLNQIYQAMLQFPERIPQLIQEVLELIPKDWVEVMEKVARERRPCKVIIRRGELPQHLKPFIERWQKIAEGYTPS